MEDSMTRWEQQRKLAKQLENEIDSKLVSFSRLASAFTSNALSSPPLSSDKITEATSLEIEELLKKVFFFFELFLNYFLIN